MAGPIDEQYIELLNTQRLDELLSLANAQLQNVGDPMASLMASHALIRQGLFREAIEALNGLAHHDPSKSQFVHDLTSMCTRELEMLAAPTDAALHERLTEMDLWSREDAGAANKGQAVLAESKVFDFDDVRDLDDSIGRRLVVYLLDRVLHIPFVAISSFELTPRSAMFFDDVWIPVRIVLRPGEPLEQVEARVPALYPGSLAHPDPLIASGRQTRFEDPEGNRVAIGLRDFGFDRGGSQAMVGIHNLSTVVFH